MNMTTVPGPEDTCCTRSVVLASELPRGFAARLWRIREGLNQKCRRHYETGQTIAASRGHQVVHESPLHSGSDTVWAGEHPTGAQRVRSPAGAIRRGAHWVFGANLIFAKLE